MSAAFNLGSPEWDSFLLAHADVPNLLGAVLHARRLGLSPANVHSITVALRNAEAEDTPRVNFVAESFHCDVSPSKCRLYAFAPGAVEFDRFGNPHFGGASA